MNEVGKIELIWCQMKPNYSSKFFLPFVLNWSILIVTIFSNFPFLVVTRFSSFPS